jgi:hypothetical protein
MGGMLGPAALVLGPAALVLVLGPATLALVILNGITSHYFMKSISILCKKKLVQP